MRGWHGACNLASQWVSRVFRMLGLVNLRWVLTISLFLLGHGPVLAHSDASGFAAPEISAHSDRAVGEENPRYPAFLSVDPRQLVNVVVKINARVVKLGSLYPGKRILAGEVLGEMESAELETIQSSYLAIYSNMDAVQSFSMTTGEKLVDARMNLAWRGMSEDDIRQLENRREPLKRVRLRAPVSGYLYSLDVVNNQILNTSGQVGQYTMAGTTIASIVRPAAVQIEVELPARVATGVKPGDPAVLHLADSQGGAANVAAVVRRVYAYTNPINQRQRVRLGLNGQLPGGIDLSAGRVASVSLGGDGHGH